MGGTFAAEGIGVVNVVVKGQLVPLLGHFRQVVAGQHLAHGPGRALHGTTKVVGQPQLFALVAVGADHVLHDLHKHACCITAEGGMGAVEHLVIERLQGAQPTPGLGLAFPQVAQQVNDSVGHAGNRRGHQLLDAMGVQIRLHQAGVGLAGVCFQNAINQGQDFLVLPVKKNAVPERARHAASFVRRCGAAWVFILYTYPTPQPASNA